MSGKYIALAVTGTRNEIFCENGVFRLSSPTRPVDRGGAVPEQPCRIEKPLLFAILP